MYVDASSTDSRSFTSSLVGVLFHFSPYFLSQAYVGLFVSGPLPTGRAEFTYVRALFDIKRGQGHDPYCFPLSFSTDY